LTIEEDGESDGREEEDELSDEGETGTVFEETVTESSLEGDRVNELLDE